MDSSTQCLLCSAPAEQRKYDWHYRPRPSDIARGHVSNGHPTIEVLLCNDCYHDNRSIKLIVTPTAPRPEVPDEPLCMCGKPAHITHAMGGMMCGPCAHEYNSGSYG